ncbi:MAG: 50S ribosomal protein L11 methyltransferase [Sulfurospirillaceae bacterium]|nr:50S ribosomal protein L11 methyltransferase [Sulfurospirillaceae bacterium]
MQKTYNELHITPNQEYSLFADFVLTLTDDAIEECANTIILRSEENLDMVVFGVQEFAKRLSLAFGKEISVETSSSIKENEDWINKYKDSIQPLHVKDFYIRPSWVQEDGKFKNIIIDPALAFGSGHHETTYGCLLLLQKYLHVGDTVLDVGCGSGILSIASAKLGAVVDLCDTDDLAVHSAKANFLLNNEEFSTVWVGSVQKRQKQYDMVVANIIADVLIMISSDLEKAVKEGGMLMLSGILDKYVNRVEQKFNAMTLIEKYKKDEWFTLVFKKV